MKLSKLASVILVVLAFCLPWVNSTLTVNILEETKNIFLLVAVLVLGLIYLYRSYLRKDIRFVKTPFDFPVILWMAINLISSFLSVSAQYSGWGVFNRMSGSIVSTLSLGTLYFLIVNLLENETEIRSVVKGMIISVGLMGLVYLLKITGVIDPVFLALSNRGIISPLLSNGSFSLVGGYDQLSILFLVTVPLTLQYIVDANKSADRVMGVSSVIFQIATFIGINFNSLPLFSAIASIILMLATIIYIFIKYRQVWFETHIASSIVIVGAILVSILLMGIPSIKTAINLKTDFVRAPELNFTDAWYVSTKTWTEIPIKGLLIGSGPDTYVIAFNRFKPDYLATLEFDKSSSQVFEIMSNIGLLGLAVFLFMLFKVLNFTFKKLSILANQTEGTLIFGLSLSALLYLVSNFFNGNFITVQSYFYIILGLMSVMYIYNNKMNNEELSFSFKLNRNKLTEERTLELLPMISLILLSVFMVYTVINVGSSYMSSINFQKALNKESEAVKFLNSKENKIEKLEDKKTLIGLYKEAYNLALESNRNQTRDYSLRQLSIYALYIVLNNQRKVDSTDKVLTDDELNGYLTSLSDNSGSVNLALSANPNNYFNYEAGALVFQQLYNLNQSIVSSNKDAKPVELKDRPYFTQALTLANASIKLNPYRIDTMLVLGQLLTASSSQEDITTAKNLFETAYRLNRSNLNSVSLLGQFYEATQNYTTAKQLYTFTKENYVQKDSELYKNLDSKITEMDKKIAETPKK